MSINSFHRIAARLRFGMNLKSLIWAARGDRERWACGAESGVHKIGEAEDGYRETGWVRLRLCPLHDSG